MGKYLWYNENQEFFPNLQNYSEVIINSKL